MTLFRELGWALPVTKALEHIVKLCPTASESDLVVVVINDSNLLSATLSMRRVLPSSHASGINRLRHDSLVSEYC